jgi:hypothetical protein
MTEGLMKTVNRVWLHCFTVVRVHGFVLVCHEPVSGLILPSIFMPPEVHITMLSIPVTSDASDVVRLDRVAIDGRR